MHSLLDERKQFLKLDKLDGNKTKSGFGGGYKASHITYSQGNQRDRLSLYQKRTKTRTYRNVSVVGGALWWLDSFSINESLVRIPTQVGSRKGRQTGRKYGRAGGLDCLRSTFSIEAEAPYSDCKKGIQSMSMG